MVSTGMPSAVARSAQHHLSLVLEPLTGMATQSLLVTGHSVLMYR